MSQVAAVVTPPRWALPPAAARRPLRVAVLSRHALTRAGLTQLLSQGGERSTVVEGPIRTLPFQSHDVVVFDFTDPSGTARDDFAFLVAEGIPVVALTPSVSPDLVEAALAMGAADTVSMDIAAGALLQLLEHAAAVHAIDPAAHARICGPVPQTTAPLSERERAVLQLIGTGLTNQHIADRLYLSINTVKTYIRSAYRKIGVSRRAEAVLWTIRHEVTAPIAACS